VRTFLVTTQHSPVDVAGLVAAVNAAVERTYGYAAACVATDWRVPVDGCVVDRDVDGWQSAPDGSRVFSFWDHRYAEAMHACHNDPDTVKERVKADRELLQLHRAAPSNPDVCVTCRPNTWGKRCIPRDQFPCATFLAIARSTGVLIREQE
jgi:hypothetical protein